MICNFTQNGSIALLAHIIGALLYHIAFFQCLTMKSVAFNASTSRNSPPVQYALLIKVSGIFYNAVQHFLKIDEPAIFYDWILFHILSMLVLRSFWSFPCLIKIFFILLHISNVSINTLIDAV